MPRTTKPSHWLAGVVTHALSVQLSVVAWTGQPTGFASIVSQGMLVDLTLQKRSVEYGIPLMQ